MWQSCKFKTVNWCSRSLSPSWVHTHTRARARSVITRQWFLHVLIHYPCYTDWTEIVCCNYSVKYGRDIFSGENKIKRMFHLYDLLFVQPFQDFVKRTSFFSISKEWEDNTNINKVATPLPTSLVSAMRENNMDAMQDCYGLSSHVTAHIVANEDKSTCEHTKFQWSLQQINHLQFYPCPLGRRSGPWCSIRRVMRATSLDSCRPRLLLETRENKRASEAISLEARRFLEMVWRLDLQDHPSTEASSPTAHQDFIKWWAAPPHPHSLHSIITSTPSSPFFSLLRHFSPKPNEEMARLVADRPRVGP